MPPVSADLVWKPGLVVILDERLTDVDAYQRREWARREQLSFFLEGLDRLELEGAAR